MAQLKTLEPNSAPLAGVIWSLFLVLSGIASLTYQVTWVRLLGLSMGSTSASISTVVGAFFLGLSLGSFFAERIVRRRLHSPSPYLWLELIIGVSGLVLLPVLLNLDGLMALFPAQGASLVFKFVVAMLLLSVPTICMGATFPVVAALAIREQRSVGAGLSHLYSLNTAGAVAGACLSGFFLIPAYGLDGATYFAAALNFAVVGIGFFFRHDIKTRLVAADFVATETASNEIPVAASTRFAALIALFCTGLVSIATEVGWTKYLSIFTGTTIYGFAAILVVFLIGISFGSWWARNRLAGIKDANHGLALGLVLLAAALLLTRAGLSAVPDLFQAVNSIDAPAGVVHGIKYVGVFVLLIIPTTILGALFPLNLMMYCGGLTGVRHRVGRAYAVNTVAGIFGSIAAGFWIIPRFGTDVLLVACAAIIISLAGVFALMAMSRLRRAALLSAVVLVMTGFWVVPGIDYSRLISSVSYTYDVDAREGKTPKITFLEEGKAGVITVATYDDVEMKLQNNGLNESVIYADDLTHGLIAEQLLGLIPYFLHNRPKTAFVVGFGGGITTRALTYTDLESIRVVELEPAVINAGRSIAKGEIPVLQDSRVVLEFNDARNTLLLDSQRYDIIVSQPSHPWIAGAANVFTTQFFEIAKSRLNDDGIYGQWVNLFNMDATTLRSILHSFFNVFPYGVTFGNLQSGDYLLFGSVAPLEFKSEIVDEKINRPKISAALTHFDVSRASDLYWYLSMTRANALKVSEGSLSNTDTNLLTEVRLSRFVKNPVGDENPYSFIRRNYSFELDELVPKDKLVERYVEAGNAFLRFDVPRVGYQISTRLEALDANAARELKYFCLLQEERVPQAIELFSSSDHWSDKALSRQSELLAVEAKFDAAQKTLARIADPKLRAISLAKLSYYRHDSRPAVKEFLDSPDVAKWEWLRAAGSDLRHSGEALARLNLSARKDLPLIRTMIAYFSLARDDAQVDRYSKLLAEAIDARVQRLSDLALNSAADSDVSHLEYLIKRIQSMDATAKVLGKLNARLKELKAKKNATQEQVSTK